MLGVRVEDVVLRELHRAAAEAGRRSVSVPSIDLDAVAGRAGGREAAQKALQRLVRAERIVRVRKDLLVLPDATGLLGVDMGELVDAVAPRPYVITAGRALEHHDLTDQHFFAMAVLTPTRVKTLVWRGQTATFWPTAPSGIWGRGDGTGPCYARPERALLDAVNHPRYGVALTMAVDVLVVAASRDTGFLDRLHQAAVRYNSPAAARRVGLIVERVFGFRQAARYLDLLGENRAAVLLRPGAPADGPVDKTWRVRLNASLGTGRVPA